MDLVTEQVSLARGFQIENGVISRCNGIGLKNMLHSARQWLEAHAGIVNNLNVYPVPDGDTGTNMVLTMQAALTQVEQIVDHDDVSAVAAAAAEGALMGARGNSGVILSQFLHGLAEGFRGQETFAAADFARAAQLATSLAYESVIEPVEGTILTVARAVSEIAQQSAQSNTDLMIVFADVLRAAKTAQADTPLLLPILKEAGVTDSGGQGLVYLMEGALRYLQGQPVDAAPADAGVLVRSAVNVADSAYGYDVQFLIRGSGLNVTDIRNHIDRIGWSTLVVGDERLVKVHVHTEDPGMPLSYGAQQGIVSDVVIENLDEQARAFTQQPDEVGRTTAVAVASGEGFARIFESLGVSRVVTGGQTQNPSVEDLLAAINQLPADNVVVLPNNSNVILAAQQAQKLVVGKNVVVLPTRTLPQGIAALLSFNRHIDMDTNVQRMAETARQVQTIHVTRVARDSKFNGFKMKTGDVIGLLDNELVSTGQDVDAVSMDVLARMDIDLYEIVTIYFGHDCLLAQAQALADQVTAQYPDLDVEVHEGGQPHYHYIISME